MPPLRAITNFQLFLVWSYDAQVSPEEIDLAISELERVGLIEFDHEENFVRIVGWFHKRSGPDNPNRVQSVIRDLADMSNAPSEMIQRSAAELAVASVKRSIKWQAEGPARNQLQSQLRELLGDLHSEHGDGFLKCIKDELASASARISIELGVLFPPLTVLHVDSD